MSGWIKIHRCITKHWIYTEKRSFSKFEAWIDILMTVNFADAQVLCQGMDVNLLPEGTSFYFTTDGTVSGGLINAPTNVSGLNRYVIVERVGTFWCRVSKLTGQDVALFRTDVPSGYLFSSATALTF